MKNAEKDITKKKEINVLLNYNDLCSNIKQKVENMQKEKTVFKHRFRKIDTEDEKKIRYMQNKEGYKTFTEAKEVYFNNLDAGKVMVLPEPAVSDFSPIAEEKPKQKGPMTIKESKLGATLVLTHKDCEKLGFDINKQTTKEVVKFVRDKLGLPEKPIRA